MIQFYYVCNCISFKVVPTIPAGQKGLCFLTIWLYDVVLE